MSKKNAPGSTDAGKNDELLLQQKLEANRLAMQQLSKQKASKTKELNKLQEDIEELNKLHSGSKKSK